MLKKLKKQSYGGSPAADQGHCAAQNNLKTLKCIREEKID